MGIIGGTLGYHVLKATHAGGGDGRMDGSAYAGKSKLETLLGPQVWTAIQDKVVIDFGCGSGAEAVEMATRGARKVIGLDIQERFLDIGRDRAWRAGVGDRCVFARHTQEKADVCIAIDSFEHFADPAAILEDMHRLLKPGGRVLLAFGPTWYHPLGGHLFSVFPWAHLIFTERALMRWRSDFKTDGATRFGEVDGGLNQMTIRRFEKIVEASPFRFAEFEARPIRALTPVANRVTREATTAIVRCTLVSRRSPRAGPVRVALVAASPRIVGGQSVQAQALADGLRDAGHDVAFVPIDPAFPRLLQWVRRVRYARTVLNEALYLRRLRALKTAGVVHIFSASYCSFLLTVVPAILAARRFGVPTVLHYHSGEADDHLAHWGPLVHPWLRRVDAIVVPSDYLREVFARHGYHAQVVPNVVDTSRFSYRARETVGPRLLSTRNLEAYYRVDNTIAAFALIQTRYRDATLTVAGDGSERDALRRLADTLRLTGVRFVGRVDPADMPALHDSADIFVNSSTLDNQPVSVLEAFAAGLPVVSTPTGDIAALVRDGETGLIVPPGDPAAMARAVGTLLEHQALAHRLARNARDHVDAFTWMRVRDRWASVYAGACA
jgi:glycosyltransferase involved in cell wall biosynthesis